LFGQLSRQSQIPTYGPVTPSNGVQTLCKTWLHDISAQVISVLTNSGQVLFQKPKSEQNPFSILQIQPRFVYGTETNSAQFKKKRKKQHLRKKYHLCKLFFSVIHPVSWKLKER
jgi:hypothetical protein